MVAAASLGATGRAEAQDTDQTPGVDSTAAVVRFSAGVYALDESAGTTTTEVILVARTEPDTDPPLQGFRVRVSSQVHTASPGDDYRSFFTRITFRGRLGGDWVAVGDAYESEARVEVRIVNDDIDEDDETFGLLLEPVVDPGPTIEVAPADPAAASRCTSEGCESLVTIVDDDTRGVIVDQTGPLSVKEGGTADYTVVLGSEPTAEVTVTPALAGIVDADLSVSPALAFTSENWRVPQAVTVKSRADDNPTDGSATVTHAVSGGDYEANGATAAPVSVFEEDLGAADPVHSGDVTIAAEHATALEGIDDVVFTVSRQVAADYGLDVPVTLSAGIIEADQLSHTVTIAAGEVSARLVVATASLHPDAATGDVTATVGDGVLHDVGDPSSASVRVYVEAKLNISATGLPTISGRAQVGETLTADTSGVADQNGLENATFGYQWLAEDTAIDGATGGSYTLADADQGKAIKVRVSFTDGGGNEETLTSAPTEPVLGGDLPGAPRNLTATAGDREVSLSWEPPADNGNAPVTRYRIEWRIDGKDYSRWSQWGTSRGTTYTTTDGANLANGVKYFFRVSAGNGSGYGHGPYGPASEEVSATPTSGSAVDRATPVLSDTEVLHAHMVRLDWQDVEGAGWYVVQYYDLKGAEWLDLPAVGVDVALRGSSAVVSGVDGLSWLRVRALSCAGESEWSQIEQLILGNASEWEGVPVPEVADGDEVEPCPVVLGTPVLSDTEVLHAHMVRLDWQDVEGAGWYVVQYYDLKGAEWLDLPAVGVDVAFHGSSAVVSGVDALSWLRVGAASCAVESEWSQIEQLLLDNASQWEGVPVPEVADGDETEPCSEDADTPDNSPATGAPTISGTAQVGETLTADTSGVVDADGLSNVQYGYQWLADDSEIAAATGSTYTLVADDEGKAIKVQVSFTDDADNDETLMSAATAAVAAAQPAEPPAKPEGLSATASYDSVTLTWDDPGDDSITGYAILRRISGVDPEGHFDELVADTGTAAATYTDDTVSAETRYTYGIKAINEYGVSERSDWYHIDTPETPEGAPVVRFLSPPETISEDVTGPYYIVGAASENERISITANTGFILANRAETETHCPIYFQRPGGNLELAPVVDGYVPTEDGEQIYYRDGEPVTSNVDNSYLTLIKSTASTEGFYLRNCAAEPMDGYVDVRTYRDDGVPHLTRIRITQPSPFEITTGPPPD